MEDGKVASRSERKSGESGIALRSGGLRPFEILRSWCCWLKEGGEWDSYTVLRISQVLGWLDR